MKELERRRIIMGRNQDAGARWGQASNDLGPKHIKAWGNGEDLRRLYKGGF